MNYAIILAGGNGTRFEDKLPKQFHILKDKPLIVHTLERFVENKNISKIVVVVHKDYVDYAQLYINNYFNKEDIHITTGGETRNQSVKNGCDYINERFDIRKEDIVVIHEAVRPFINKRIIDENIMALDKFDCVSTLCPVQESMMEEYNGEIKGILNRTHIYIGQAPQSFRLLEFIELNRNLEIDTRKMLTEDTKVYIMNNKRVGIVLGEKYNIKITTPYDLKLAEFILETVYIK